MLKNTKLLNENIFIVNIIRKFTFVGLIGTHKREMQRQMTKIKNQQDELRMLQTNFSFAFFWS